MEMLAAFLTFDNNKDGYVDATDFKETMNRMEQPFGEFEVNLFIGEMDKKRQGKLSFNGKVLLLTTYKHCKYSCKPQAPDIIYVSNNRNYIPIT